MPASFSSIDCLIAEKDKKILSDINKNQDITFEDVYSDCSSKILNLAFRFTSDEEQARDLTQEVFIKVYQNLENFKGESSVFTWVYRIAVNHILNFLKKEKRRKFIRLIDQNVKDAIMEETQSGISASNNPTPAQVLEDEERTRIVKSFIDELAPNYQVPFTLFKYEGMSYKEIAESLEISLSAVETRIHRARKQLITKLEPWLKHL
ncbi:MAG: sigma-70 family RNA polymerase sigma factor [Ignavibacterium sp.]|nr:MAG: sigma-70 family RNA polymerase sigma factor [Ignavibacterium sp.]